MYDITAIADEAGMTPDNLALFLAWVLVANVEQSDLDFTIEIDGIDGPGELGFDCVCRFKIPKYGGVVFAVTLGQMISDGIESLTEMLGEAVATLGPVPGEGAGDG